MDLDPAVAALLADNNITAVPDSTGRLIFVTHIPSGVALERAIFPDLLNAQHAVDALLIEAGKTGWVTRDSNPEPAT